MVFMYAKPILRLIGMVLKLIDLLFRLIEMVYWLIETILLVIAQQLVNRNHSY